MLNPLEDIHYAGFENVKQIIFLLFNSRKVIYVMLILYFKHYIIVMHFVKKYYNINLWGLNSKIKLIIIQFYYYKKFFNKYLLQKKK